MLFMGVQPIANWFLLCAVRNTAESTIPESQRGSLSPATDSTWKSRLVHLARIFLQHSKCSGETVYFLNVNQMPAQILPRILFAQQTPCPHTLVGRVKVVNLTKLF